MSERKLLSCLQALRLPVVKAQLAAITEQAANQSWGYEQYLFELLELERTHRENNRIMRNLGYAHLPQGKTLSTLERNRLPGKVRTQIDTLIDGGFLDRAENILIFGTPGSGKTHVACALAHELIYQGRRILFKSCSIVIQELLVAKRDLTLASYLKKLEKIDAIIIDDIGYVQQEREEMELLFTLLAARYETGSVIITSNLPFSSWEQIFKDPMTTAAAIDRLVHHSIIMELNIASYRLEAAQHKNNTGGDTKS